jgi:hypothetical protein
MTIAEPIRAKKRSQSFSPWLDFSDCLVNVPTVSTALTVLEQDQCARLLAFSKGAHAPR